MKLSSNKLKSVVFLCIILCHSTMPIGEPLTDAEVIARFEREMYQRQGSFWKAFDRPVTLVGIVTVWAAASVGFFTTIISSQNK
ncbi:MAG TPA: hypothetical protein VL201_03750 [Patescibacteria group bacterium]|jgi:hypothetical protein|nr:hypothetical protein [Patescibacteria group bacterium]